MTSNRCAAFPDFPYGIRWLAEKQGLRNMLLYPWMRRITWTALLNSPVTEYVECDCVCQSLRTVTSMSSRGHTWRPNRQLPVSRPCLRAAKWQVHGSPLMLWKRSLCAFLMKDTEYSKGRVTTERSRGALRAGEVPCLPGQGATCWCALHPALHLHLEEAFVQSDVQMRQIAH